MSTPSNLESERSQKHFVFYMGKAAGIASRLGLERISRVLMLMGRTPTEFYTIPPGEAAYMREALELIAQRWLPLELFRCEVGDADELREALQMAIDEAATIERSAP